MTGKVAGVSGLLIESRGGLSRLAVGARAEIERRGQPPLPAEVVGFRGEQAVLLPLGELGGIAPAGAVKAYAEQIKPLQFKEFAGRRHDILNEDVHREVAADVVAFIEVQIG